MIDLWVFSRGEGETVLEGVFEVFSRGLEVRIHRDCLLLWSSDVFFFWIHRNLVFMLNPDVSGIYGFFHIHRECTIQDLSDVLLN